jgi:hypothetical protein
MQKFYVKYSVQGYGEKLAGPYEGMREAEYQRDDIAGWVGGATIVPAEEVEAAKPATRFDLIG